ncbi:hypothetical protein ACPEAN_11715 [Ralstonia solanacearum]|uniref:hypothetical protein n=1 Tax=Ralstonia solanacearum TaxID=305 RepID=UPI001FFA1883
MWVQEMTKQMWVNVVLATGAWGLSAYLGVGAYRQIGHGKSLSIYLPIVLFSTLFVIVACIYSVIAFLYLFRVVRSIQRDEQGLALITSSGRKVIVAKPPRLIKEIGDPLESQSRYAIFAADGRLWVCKASEFSSMGKG